MATYDDFHGVYFTVEILRSFFREVLEETHAEIICVDTNPQSAHGKECRSFFTHWCNGGWDESRQRYMGDTTRGTYIDGGHLQGTAAPRDLAIRKARGEVVLCIDCHVIPQPGSLQALVKYFRDNPESIDLIHGPLIMDNFRPLATRMDPRWGEDKMFGKWGYDHADEGPDGRYRTDLAPFEIPMHGLGLFACRKVAWRGFNPKFRGFGGEEGYIHDKFRDAGGKVICLPELLWLHRFGRPDGAGYRNDLTDRFYNYVTGRHERNANVGEVLQQFAGRIPDQAVGQIMIEMAKAG
jgi:hypothetical protein